VEGNIGQEGRRKAGIATPDFLLLTGAQSVSHLGSAIYSVALPLFALSRWGSGAVLGLVMAASLLPFTLAGPIGGAYVDRWNRRRVIVVCDFISGVVTLGVAYLAWADALTLPILTLATALVSLTSAFFFPAIMASLPNMVEEHEFARAASLMEMSRSLTRILGPAVGGLLVAWLGFPMAFLLNGLSFLVAAAAESFVFIPQAAVKRETTVIQDLREAARYILATPLLSSLLKVTAVANFFEPAILPILMPIVAVRVLQVGDAGYGYMRGVAALGGFTALLIVVTAGKLIRRPGPRHMAAGLASMGLSIALLGLRPGFPLTLALLFVYGLLAGVGDILAVTLMLGQVPDTMRGKVVGLVSAVAAVMIPVSFLALGALADVVSTSPLLFISGAAVALAAVFVYRAPWSGAAG